MAAPGRLLESPVVLFREACYYLFMTLTIPEGREPEADVRLELACAIYARGKTDKVTGAHLAGVDFFTFQRALGERGIFSYTEEMLDEDVRTLQELFPR